MDPVAEGRIAELGRALLDRARAAAPRCPSPAWFDDRGMAWSMRDPRLKAGLFRVVDCLPALADDAAIVRHLGEYLSPQRDRFPPLVRWAIGRTDWPWPALQGTAVRIGARRLATRFIAGATPQQAATTLRGLRARRLAATIDLLGEAVLSEDEADAYRDAYLELAGALADDARGWADDDLLDASPRVNLSLKLSALTSRFDPLDPRGTSQRVSARLRPVLRAARLHGCFVNIDMEHHAYKDTTLRILRDVLDETEFRTWPDAGIAIQAYLRETAADLTSLVQWAQRRGTAITVRLVKGAYWDSETVWAAQRGWEPPVFTDKAATDLAFESATRFLFTHREWLRPAIAGHNVRSIAQALACAERCGANAHEYEFQMLYGMVASLQDAVAGLGRRVRVYAPFGELLPGMAYLVRRLLENTSNTSFVRASFLEGGESTRLLMPPQPQSATPPPAISGFRNEPLAEAHRGDVQQRWDAALVAAHRRLPQRVVPSINDVDQPSCPTWTWRNPSRLSEVVAEVTFADAAQVHQAIEHAARCVPAWAATPVSERAGALRRLSAALTVERDALTALMILEVGKNRREADADVAEAIDFCRFYADEGERLLVTTQRDVPGELNRTIYEARGVAAIIAPWNFPLAILCGMAVANLVVGNPVLLKPAEQASATGAAFAKLCRGIFPRGVVQFLPGDGAVIGPLMVRHPQVSVIAFTGSRAVGLGIARAAIDVAESVGFVKKVVAEMGGKNAIIIDDDADLDEAVQGVVASAFGFQGQKCSACSRVIVLPAVAAAFSERLIAATRSLIAGEAEDVAASFGPVIDAEAAERLRATVSSARTRLRLAWSGSARDGGHFVAPAIFTDVPPDDALAQEECFGPILAVITARDLDHALRIANGTHYALTGGIYSRSPATLDRVRRELRVGNLYLNRPITGALVDRQPFGGFRLSGLGAKAGSAEYLGQFVETRCISENTLRHGIDG